MAPIKTKNLSNFYVSLFPFIVVFRHQKIFVVVDLKQLNLHKNVTDNAGHCESEHHQQIANKLDALQILACEYK